MKDSEIKELIKTVKDIKINIAVISNNQKTQFKSQETSSKKAEELTQGFYKLCQQLENYMNKTDRIINDFSEHCKDGDSYRPSIILNTDFRERFWKHYLAIYGALSTGIIGILIKKLGF